MTEAVRFGRRKDIHGVSSDGHQCSDGDASDDNLGDQRHTTPSTFASTAGAETLKVAVAQRGFWNSTFVDIAEQQGFFKEAGYEVDFVVGKGGVDVAKQVGVGNAQIGGGIGDTPIIVRGNGVPVSATRSVTRWPRPPVCISSAGSWNS